MLKLLEKILKKELHFMLPMVFIEICWYGTGEEDTATTIGNPWSLELIGFEDRSLFYIDYSGELDIFWFHIKSDEPIR